MSSPLQQTTNVDVDAVPELRTQESRAPAGSAGSPLPAVGTNAVNEWAMWDPNLWWTDWSLPPDPRPSWEQWFEWVNQLRALTPALGEASRDWETMIGQLDDAQQRVRTMRSDLSTWTGPSAQTMTESLDRLEEALTTKTAAIRDNPRRLQDLAQTINDAVPPMSALDAEYQQVLQDLNACRQVAERGKPIMLNLATKLLQTGTDLENSVRADKLAPQPVPPQPLALTNGPQGPTQQLAQVAGSANLADPGNVTPSAQIPVEDLPAPVGPSGVADPGAVTGGAAVPVPGQPGVAASTGSADSAASVPGVAVTPAETNSASLASGAAPGAPAVAASPTLASGGAGMAAPTAAAAPVATPALASSAPVPPVVAAPAISGPVSAGAAAEPRTAAGPAPAVAPAVAPAEERKEERGTPAAVRAPAPVVVPGASGAAAVPDGLRGRTGGQPAGESAGAPRSEHADPESPDAFTVKDAGNGTISAPK